MGQIVLLDAGPTGPVICPPAVAGVIPCRAWLAAMEASGADVLIPTIVDYELRRELLRIGATTKIRLLDELTARFGVVDVSASAFRKAADLWANVRQAGKPTADPKALDADTIIAGIATTIGESWDVVVVATINVGHFARFPGVEAREWQAIT